LTTELASAEYEVTWSSISSRGITGCDVDSHRIAGAQALVVGVKAGYYLGHRTVGEAGLDPYRYGRLVFSIQDTHTLVPPKRLDSTARNLHHALSAVYHDSSVGAHADFHRRIAGIEAYLYEVGDYVIG
jgi:hypothetical protein